MSQPEPIPRPPLWVVGALVLLVVGVMIAIGRRRDASTEVEAATTSLASPVTTSLPSPPSSTTVAPSPEVDAVSPTFTASFVGDGAETPGGILVALVGQGDTDLLLFTFGGEGGGSVVHDMPRNTYGPVRFDWSRNQYAFIDSTFRLHTRPTQAGSDDVSLSEAIALDVRSFAWSLDEAGRIAWVTFEGGGPLLVEGTDHVRVVGNPGVVDLVGFDSTGFYVVWGHLGTPGEAWLRKLDIDGTFVADVLADVVHVGSDGLVVIGSRQGAQVGPSAYDWYLTDQDLAPLTPIVGAPPSALAIATNHWSPRAVAFLSYVGFRASIDIYSTESGLTQRFDLGEVRTWDMQWSDDDRFIVVSGAAEQEGRGHFVQLLDTDTGLITALAFNAWVQEAQLIWQPSSPSTIAPVASDGVEVPDVRGLTLTEAATVIDAAGLIGVVSDFDSQDDASVVRAQEPGAGERIPIGSTIGFRTLTVTRLGCDSSVLGPSIAGVPGTYGGVTLAGLTEGAPVVHGNLSPEGTGWHFPLEVVTQLDAGTQPVWVVLPGERPGEAAGLLYDRAVFRDVGRYLLTETSQAVRLERCSSDSHTQYVGGLVVDGSRCIDIWIYEESLTTVPTMIRVGIDTSC